MKVFSLIIIFFFGSNLFAQSILKDTVKIQEVEVTVVKPPVKDRSAIPVQSVNRDELNRLAGNSAADAIKNFSGITLKDYGGIGGLKTVIVRSLGANHTGVFIDGVQFSDVATGQIDLGKITTDNAGEISLYIGHPSDICLPARYFASASIININSLIPDFSSKPFQVSGGLKAGSYGMFNPKISFQNKLGQKSFSNVSFNYTKAEGNYPFRLQYGYNIDTIAKRENSDIESANFDVTLATVLRDSSKLSFKAYYYGSERGLPGAVVFYNPAAKQRLWNKDLFTNIQYKTDPNKPLLWLINFKYSFSRLRYLDPDYLNYKGKLDNRYLQHEYYFSQVLNWKVIDSLQVSFATDIFLNKLNANLYRYTNPVRYSALTVMAFQYKRNGYEMNSNILTTIVRDKNEQAGVPSVKTILTPSVTLGYRLWQNPNIRLRFLYKDVFRMPTFNDLYYTFGTINDLKPEYARQYNAGITSYFHCGIVEYASFKADLFFNRVKDKIVSVPSKNLFIWSMRNIGKVDIRGIELQAQFQTKIFSPLNYLFSCNYTYQHAKDISVRGSSTYNRQIAYIPFETFSTLSSLSYKNLSFNYNLLYNGFRYVLDENIYSNMIPSWWISDISTIYEIEVRKYLLQIKGEISNLLNKQYEVIRSFPMPGKTFSISLTLNY